MAAYIIPFILGFGANQIYNVVLPYLQEVKEFDKTTLKSVAVADPKVLNEIKIFDHGKLKKTKPREPTPICENPIVNEIKKFDTRALRHIDSIQQKKMECMGVDLDKVLRDGLAQHFENINTNGNTDLSSSVVFEE